MSEENIRWKQEEKQLEKQKAEKMEELEKLVDILLAEEPRNDQIVINEENIEESEKHTFVEEHPDQPVKEEENIEEKTFENLKEQNQGQLLEQKEKEAENALETKESETEREKNRQTEREREEDSKEEEEESTITKEQVLTNEGENDQVVIREDQSLALDTKVKDTLDEGIEQKSDQIKEIQDIRMFVEEINKQLETREELEPKTYSYLNSLNADGSYPNIAFVYKRDGSKSVEILDRGLYEKLIENQKLGNFRLEWQRYWFEGINEIKPTEQGRKIFLIDLTKEKELPVSMRRIYLARNTYTWNTLAPTKRELHSKNLREFTETLFGKRSKYSDFENVKDFTYQKKMNFVWKEFQRVFSKDIKLKTTKRPALFALKSEYTRESVEHAMIGTFWKYHSNLDRIAKRNMKKWGYNNLLQHMEKKATGVYPTIVDPNYVGQNFIIRVVNKGRGFARFLETIEEIKGTDPKYAINKLYRSWIIDNEILQSKSIDGIIWSVNKARATRYINFDNIPHLMSENNSLGINAVLEAFFEDQKMVKVLNNYLGTKFPENGDCSSTGYARVNTGAISIAYPDLVLEQINMQIKDLGKCSDQDKKALVLIDQFKSFFGASEDIDKITVHVINGLDLANVYDVKSYPEMTHNNVGIINIGIWKNVEGINKFGEIFSALRISHDAGLTGKEAFENVLEYFNSTGQFFSKTDQKILRQLQELWSEDPAELVVNICENFGEFFQDKSVTEEGIHPESKSISLQKGDSEDNIRNLLFLENNKLKETLVNLSTKFESLYSKLKEKPLFQTFWAECTGVTDIVERKYTKNPRGFIVDLTSDPLLPNEYKKVYMVKNSERWNVQGYSDKILTERQFDDFSNMFFRRMSLRRDFENSSDFPDYIWEQIRMKAQDKVVLQQNHFRPVIYTLNENIIDKNIKSEEIIDISLKETVSPDILVNLINNQLNSSGKIDRKYMDALIKVNIDDRIPNIAFIKTIEGKFSLELLEPHLYDILKSKLKLSSYRLGFQRYWFECTDKIEVLTEKNIGTPKGLIVDLSTDTFLPNKHKKAYMVKNTERWNVFGYKDNLLSEGGFDDFTTMLFNKKTIRDFGHHEYPHYIWEQIQKKWGIKNRKGFELDTQKYRPNIFALKHQFSKKTVEYAMIGVYTEYLKTLNYDQRRSLKKAGFRNLARYFDYNKRIPKVMRPSKLPHKDFEKLF